jgi:hypothetical protein
MILVRDLNIEVQVLKSKLPTVLWSLRRHGSVRRNSVATEPQAARSKLRWNYLGLWYRKTANATRTTVMIHRIMFLLPLFSSAMTKVQHRHKQRIKWFAVST